MYKQALKLPRSTSNLLEMGRYPMQIQCAAAHAELLGQVGSANKADSELLDFVLAAEVWQGLHEDHDQS